MKAIKVACEGVEAIDIAKMKELQGDLKSLSTENYAMLKKEMLDTGFAFPIHLWLDKSTGTRWIVGGHQRKRTLESMRQEGYKVPPVPVVYVHAKDIKEARRRVLQDIAQYGQVEHEGLYEFMTEAAIAPGDLAASFKIPEIDMPAFNAEFFHDDVTGSEEEKKNERDYDQKAPSGFAHTCPRCGFQHD